jgi:GntR family transcriptional repressor for pyruvate dehydrogenase complex
VERDGLMNEGNARARGRDGASLVTQAMQAVRDHISLNDMKVGDALPGEGHFAAQLGVSRAVMREAFGGLAALHLIDVANGRRARVAALDGSVLASSLDHAVATAQVSMAEIWDVRQTLELRTVALAAQHRTEAQAARICQLAEAMGGSQDDPDRLKEYDIAFHQAIAEASHNRLFLQIIRSYARLMDVAVPTAWKTRDTHEQRAEALAHHRQIARAIADGDADAAVAAMTEHFDTSIWRLFLANRAA